MTYGMQFISELVQMMLIPMLPFFIAKLLQDTASLNTFTGLVVGTSAITSTLSAVYFSRLGDRVGHSRLVICGSIGASFFYLLMTFITAGWHLFFLMALVGIALGSIIPSISSLLAHYTHPGEEGAVYGLDNSIRSGARAIAPLLGASVALLLSLRATFTIAAIFVFIFALLAMWRLPSQENDRGAKTV